MERRPCIGVSKGEGAGPRPPFLMTVGGKEPLGEFKVGGSMESLVEMVQIEKSLQNVCVNFTVLPSEKGFLGLLKH